MTAASLDAGEAQPREPRVPPALLRVGRRVVLPAVLIVAVLVILAYAVFPIRTWLDQRSTITEREAELVEIEAANDALRARVVALGTHAEIERIARTDHNLVMPGEEAYAVLPAAPPPVRLPLAWPFTELAEALAG